MTPGGAEWGLVALTEDLMQASRQLSMLAWDFRQEARAWGHPAARHLLEDQAAELVSAAQAAALASMTGDYYSRMEAMASAVGMHSAGQIQLRRWFQRGELFNEHRMRPVPASLKGGIFDA